MLLQERTSDMLFSELIHTLASELYTFCDTPYKKTTVPRSQLSQLIGVLAVKQNLAIYHICDEIGISRRTVSTIQHSDEGYYYSIQKRTLEKIIDYAHQVADHIL